MKIAFYVVAACLLAGCMSSRDLGPLSDFYYDCSGGRGPHRIYVHRTLKRALTADAAALHAVFSDPIVYDSGANEAYSTLPGVLLRALGDDRYAAFVASESDSVQAFALNLGPKDIHNFRSLYPKTSKLFYARQRKTLEFTRLYDHYFPKHTEYVQGIYRRYYDRWLITDTPPNVPHTNPLWSLYHTFHGDTAAVHAFFHHPHRDAAGEFGEAWMYDCVLLLIRYGDDRFSQLLAREDRKTREMVGTAIDTQINFKRDHFPKTRALYHFRWGPREQPTATPNTVGLESWRVRCEPGRGVAMTSKVILEQGAAAHAGWRWQFRCASHVS